MSLKPIPPKTAAKLSEAQKYLSEMGRTGESTETFGHRLSNFLTAARSVKDVLINEIAGGNEKVKKSITPYITAAMNADPEMKKLVEARNATVHDGVLSLTTDWIPEAFPGASGDKGLNDFFRRHRMRRVGTQSVHRSHIVGMPRATELVPRAFLPDILDRDAFTVCVEHLAKVAVSKCQPRSSDSVFLDAFTRGLRRRSLGPRLNQGEATLALRD
jgi:hypothetical protein